MEPTSATPVTATAARPPQPIVGSAQTFDVNSATEAQLRTITDLTPQNIKLLIAYRASYGAFTSIEGLLEVPTFTPELLARIRDRISIR